MDKPTALTALLPNMAGTNMVQLLLSRFRTRVQANKENFRVDDDMLMRHSFESEHILE